MKALAAAAAVLLGSASAALQLDTLAALRVGSTSGDVYGAVTLDIINAVTGAVQLSRPVASADGTPCTLTGSPYEGQLTNTPNFAVFSCRAAPVGTPFNASAQFPAVRAMSLDGSGAALVRVGRKEGWDVRVCGHPVCCGLWSFTCPPAFSPLLLVAPCRQLPPSGRPSLEAGCMEPPWPPTSMSTCLEACPLLSALPPALTAPLSPSP